MMMDCIVAEDAQLLLRTEAGRSIVLYRPAQASPQSCGPDLIHRQCQRICKGIPECRHMHGVAYSSVAKSFGIGVERIAVPPIRAGWWNEAHPDDVSVLPGKNGIQIGPQTHPIPR